MGCEVFKRGFGWSLLYAQTPDLQDNFVIVEQLCYDVLIGMFVS